MNPLFCTLLLAMVVWVQPYGATPCNAEPSAPPAAESPAPAVEAPSPAIEPTRPVEAPQDAEAAQPQPTASPEAVALLERLEARSADLNTLQAKLVYDRIQGLTGDKQRRFGTLYFVSGPPARFAAHFDRRLADRRIDKQDRWYIFDGVWLVEKLADQEPKQFFKRQIVPPDVKPEDANPLALGGGPFVLPVNMKKDLVLQRFNVTLVAPEKMDPPDTVHLHLTPRGDQRNEVTEVDLWYSNKGLLPVRVRTYDEDSENESIIALTDHKTNEEINAKLIDTSEPKEKGWDVVITPWEDR